MTTDTRGLVGQVLNDSYKIIRIIGGDIATATEARKTLGLGAAA